MLTAGSRAKPQRAKTVSWLAWPVRMSGADIQVLNPKEPSRVAHLVLLRAGPPHLQSMVPSLLGDPLWVLLRCACPGREAQMFLVEGD